MQRSLGLVIVVLAAAVSAGGLASLGYGDENAGAATTRQAARGTCGSFGEGAGRTGVRLRVWPPNSGAFDAACVAHDECYATARTGRDQEACETAFRSDLAAVCTPRSSSACRAQVDRIFWAVSRFASGAVSRYLAATVVTRVVHRRVAPADDEYEGCATVLNVGNVDTEFDVQLEPQLLSSVVDTEPDTYAMDLPVASDAEVCLDTRGLSIQSIATDWESLLEEAELGFGLGFIVRLEDGGGTMRKDYYDLQAVPVGLGPSGARTSENAERVAERRAQIRLELGQRALSRACLGTPASSAPRPSIADVGRNGAYGPLWLFSPANRRYVVPAADGTLFASAALRAESGALDIHVVCTGDPGDSSWSMVVVRQRASGLRWYGKEPRAGSLSRLDWAARVIASEEGLSDGNVFSAQCEGRKPGGTWRPANCLDLIQNYVVRTSAEGRIRLSVPTRAVARPGPAVSACGSYDLCFGPGPSSALTEYQWFEIKAALVPEAARKKAPTGKATGSSSGKTDSGVRSSGVTPAPSAGAADSSAAPGTTQPIPAEEAPAPAASATPVKSAVAQVAPSVGALAGQADKLTIAPDLVVSELTGTSVTITNIGTLAAGPFSVHVGRALRPTTNPSDTVTTVRFRGLSAGGTVRSTFACRIPTPVAQVDYLFEVVELNEQNNGKKSDGRC